MVRLRRRCGGTGQRNNQTPGAGRPTGGGGLAGLDAEEPTGPPPARPESGEDEANLEYTKKATDLAIEYFKDQLAKDKPDQKLLDELKWTPDDMRRFVDQWERFKKQADSTDPARRKNMEEKMKSLGLRPRGTTLKGGQTHEARTPQVRESRRSEPPPEYADQYGRILPGRPRVRGRTGSKRSGLSSGRRVPCYGRPIMLDGTATGRPTFRIPAVIPMADPTPRYLVPFHPKRVPHHFTDVLIIGGGLAGLRAALAADPRLSVLVITKDSLRQSNSNYAQGGIAGVLDPEDRFENHIADTLRAGGDLCDRGRRRDGGPRSAGADSRADRLGHAISTRSRARWPWDAKGATATIASSTPWATPPARK